MSLINAGDYSFKPLTEVYVDPLEIVAIGLKPQRQGRMFADEPSKPVQLALDTD